MQSARTQPLDYAGRQSDDAGQRAAARRLWWTLFTATFLLTSILTAAFVFVMLFAIPRFEQVFKDFKIALPDSTIVVLHFARALYVHHAWIFAPLVPLAVATAVASLVCGIARSRRELASPLSWILLLINVELLVVLVVGGFLVYAILSPYLTLIAAVSGAPKR